MSAAVASRAGGEMGSGPRGGGGAGRGRGRGRGGGMSSNFDRPPRADESEFEARLDVEVKQIDALKAEMEALSAEIDSKNTGKEEYQRKKDEMFNKINEYQETMSALEDERKKISEELLKKKEQGQKAISQANDMKKKVGFSTPEQIDARVKELEYEMHTSTMGLKEEKSIMEEIKRLKKSKPQLAKYSSGAGAKGVNPDDSSVSLMDRRNAIMTQLNQLRDERRVHQDAQRKLIEERKGQTQHLQVHFEKRDELRKKIEAHIAERKHIQDEMYAKRREAKAKFDKDKENRQKQRDLEQRKYTTREERKRLQEQLEKEEEAPFENDIAKVEQTIKFVQGMIDGKNNKENKGKQEEEMANGHKEDEYKLPAGCSEVLPGKKKATEFWAEPTKGKGGKKTKGSPAASSSSVVPMKKKNVKHQIGMFTAFDELGVKTPYTPDEAPDVLKELEAKLTEFKQKQEAATVNKKDRRGEIEKELEELEKREAQLKVEEEEMEKERKAKMAEAAANPCPAEEEKN